MNEAGTLTRHTRRQACVSTGQGEPQIPGPLLRNHRSTYANAGGSKSAVSSAVAIPCSAEGKPGLVYTLHHPLMGRAPVSARHPRVFRSSP